MMVERLDRCKARMKVVIDVNTGSSDEAVKDAEYIRDLLDKEEKYRWHDLRVDAEDLPKDDEPVLCKREDDYIVGHNYGILPYTEEHPFTSVIAWRYFEEFEEEK